MHGYGLVSSSFSGRYPHGSSNQSSTFGGASISYPVANDRNRLALDKGRRRERDRDSISIFNDPQDIFNDRNRGPRATKLRSKSATEQGSSSVGKNVTPGNHLDSYNQLDFVTDYENAKFFIIKSFSEDNVHKSIKYNVWASTPHGNKKLDAAYHEAKEIKGNCPVFLLFSVCCFNEPKTLFYILICWDNLIKYVPVGTIVHFYIFLSSNLLPFRAMFVSPL
jgi:hypothetical protein